MPHFFKPNKINQAITEPARSGMNLDDFSKARTAHTLLAWIHAILDRKNEPSAELKKMLIEAFAFLKNAALSTDSIETLNKRLHNEETPAAQAVGDAHRKVNQLRSSIKPMQSIFANNAATALKGSSLITQGFFRSRPAFETNRRKKDIDIHSGAWMYI